MMIGGEKEVVDHLDPIFAALAPGLGNIARTPGRKDRDPRAERGYIHAGPAGAGHFVKMVHNGIEYGLMQAYAEGFDILQAERRRRCPRDERYDLDLADIAEVWRRGSVVSSWLLDLTAMALAEDDTLETTQARSPIPAKVAGLSGGDRGGGAGRRAVGRAVTRASARARSILSANACSRRCASSSAATSNGRPGGRRAWTRRHKPVCAAWRMSRRHHHARS